MENENNKFELVNSMPSNYTIKTIVIATQDIGTDYAELIKNCGGEGITLGTGPGHAFNPFKDATEEQIEAFITAYCAAYPEEFRGLVREKVVKEIEGIKKMGEEA